MSFMSKYGELIRKEYEDNKKGIPAIAKSLNTYNNKIRRILLKMGVTLRDKSTAQKLALKANRTSLPNPKGNVRSEETRIKISEQVHASWKNLSKAEKKKRAKISKDRWESMTDEQKDNLKKLSSNAIREAAKKGSKLEIFLRDELPKKGYDVVYHKKNLIPNENLEIDLFIPSIKTIIEIDGPSHFLPIWGEENLKKHIKADNHKNGLLLQAGYVVIRIKNLSKNLSEKLKRDLLDFIVDNLNNISNKFPKKTDRFIELELE